MTLHLGILLRQRAALTPQHEAIVSPQGRMTYADFDAQCDRLAGHLIAQGVQLGDRVAILSRNSSFAAIAVFAVARAGGVSVIMNWRLQGPELSYILGDCEPSALLFEEEFAGAVAELGPRCSAKVLVCAGHAPGATPHEAIQSGSTAPLAAARGGSDAAPALIMYTSGTTGRPKGAVLSHGALHWGALANSSTLNWQQSDRFLLVAPMFHIGGLSPLITNVLKGCTTVFLPDFDPLRVWETIAQERITAAMTVPVMLQTLIATAQKAGVDMSSLSWVTCGASAVPTSLIDGMRDLGVSVNQVYGITEFGGAVSYWLPSMGAHRAHTHGQPTMFCEIKIADPGTGQSVPVGVNGEILVRGPTLFSGYWGNESATADAVQAGWYRSGDIGHLDGNGDLRVVDRLKDMIISGGENIYPAELESVLARHPAVAEVAVVGRTDSTWGEVPVAHVVRRPGASLAEQDLIRLCREQLAGFKCVRAVHFTEALPRSAVGKVLKPQLRS